MIYLIAAIVAIYGLSVRKMYIYTRNAHSEGGCFARLNVEAGDVAFTFIPVLNTIAAIMSAGDSGKAGEEPNFNWLFNIRK